MKPSRPSLSRRVSSLLSVTAVAADRIAAAVDATGAWRVLRDGSTYITDDGFASTNVDATLLAWERRSA